MSLLEVLPDESFDRTLGQLLAWCEISSPSGDAAGLEAMATTLARELEARGWSVGIDRSAAEGLPVLHARLGPPEPSPLLLVGHLDTVLGAISPCREGDVLRGTGALDMKGGWAALLGALDLAASRGSRLPLPLEVLAVPDEEAGGEITRRETHARGDLAREVWVLEPGQRSGEGETLVLARRGRFAFRLVVEGRSAHAGLDFWNGRSAAFAAADWMLQAQSLSKREGESACTVSVARVAIATSELFGETPLDWRRILDPEATNVVPDRAELVGEARFRSNANRNHLVQALQEISDAVATRHEVCSFLEIRPGVPAVEAGPVARRRAMLASRLAQSRGWTLSFEEDRGGISFPNFLPVRPIPVLDGLGPIGSGMHTRSEQLDLLSLRRRIVLLADLLEATAAEAPP